MIFKIDGQVLLPLDVVKFLGVLIDCKLTFKDHVQHIISKCTSRLYFMRVLKCQGLNASGLKTFYLCNIRPILTYASPAWYFLSSQHCKSTLEQIQRTATRIILPDLEGYTIRLLKLDMPTIDNFIRTNSSNHFNTNLANLDHPLRNRLHFNTNRTSSSTPMTFNPPLCRTAKRSSSFLVFFMQNYDRQAAR